MTSTPAPRGQGLIDIFDRSFAGEPMVVQRMRYAVTTSEGVQAEMIFDLEANPLRNRDGQIVGTIVVGRDMTAQPAREEAEAAAVSELTRRYRRATDVIEEVQRALLPSRLR